MKRQRMTQVATAALVAVLFLAILGTPRASATTIDNVLFCTGASGSSCFTSAPASGGYWIVHSNMVTSGGTPTGTFTYTLTVTASANPPTIATAYLQDFSGQYFFGGATVSNLAWSTNPGNWAAPSASKAGNNGSCNGSAPGTFCGAATGAG